MLARKNRVSIKEFPNFKKKGVRFSSPHFSGTVYPTEAKTQCSVVVSKKVASKAVSRNRIRRRVYSILESFVEEVKKNTLIVFYPKKEVEKIPFATLGEEIRDILLRSNIL